MKGTTLGPNFCRSSGRLITTRKERSLDSPGCAIVFLPPTREQVFNCSTFTAGVPGGWCTNSTMLLLLLLLLLMLTPNMFSRKRKTEFYFMFRKKTTPLRKARPRLYRGRLVRVNTHTVLILHEFWGSKLLHTLEPL